LHDVDTPDTGVAAVEVVDEETVADAEADDLLCFDEPPQPATTNAATATTRIIILRRLTARRPTVRFAPGIVIALLLL
jgi:hypothetical protein